MAQLDPSRYRRLTAPYGYASSDGLYYDTTGSSLILSLGGVIVDVITASGSTADLEVTSEARGDILRRGASAWERHSAKTSGQILVGDGTDVVSVAVSGDATLSAAGAVAVTDISLASEARGDIARRGATAWAAHSAKTSGNVLLGDGTDIVSTALTGDITVNGTGVTAIGAAKVTNAMQAKPRVRAIQETLTAATLTDGLGAVGTKNMTAAIPAGARYLFTTIHSITGFAGDVSAVITLGDGSDVDRYNTGTPSIFTTAAQGVDMGVASGTAWHTAAVANIVATVTSNADITPVIAGGGSCVLTFWFLEPV